MKSRKAFLFGALALLCTCIFSQNKLIFQENKGQWPSEVAYKSVINSGSVFFEENCFTYVFHSSEDLNKVHSSVHKKENTSADIMDYKIRHHAYKVHFLNSNDKVDINAEDMRSEYYNYFIGNDPGKWAGDVKAFEKLTYFDVYDNIDINIDSRNGNLKYDIIVKPGADIDHIALQYEGVDKMYVEDGNLYVITSINEVVEQKPYAYQDIRGKRKTVKCNFVLAEDNTIRFSLPKGYNKAFSLVIDPELIASTFSGSPGDTWGHCATYDNNGNILAGGRMFNDGYPITSGSYDISYNGGVEVTITKYNPSGSSMLYSTYIGGSSDDIVQSLIVNDNGDLYIYGSTSSTNFPTTSGCYDNSNNGGIDIFITKLNSAGTSLLGSTYLGGSSTDGQNLITYNYSDDFRGEIILDGAGNAYIASFTRSGNFPVTGSAYDVTHNGGQDACVSKLNSDLSQLMWSTLLGGSGDDAGYSLRLDSGGDIYLVGGTNSNNFPTTTSVLYPNYLGGTYDGFITHLTNNGSNVARSTFFGTGSFDEVFFVDLDSSDNVYIYGLSEGNIPVTADVYSNPGSSQFITKLNSDLNSMIYSTVFGAGYTGTGYDHFSPTAFMVDICQNVYAAGWGEGVKDFPVTPDAIQSVTDPASSWLSSEFYLLVLNKNAQELLFATYFGDASGVWDHVDGGTSRFDKNGVVYEAVCGCGGGFPTLANANSTVNNSWNCDIAVFKINFEIVNVFALSDVSPLATGCAPFTVDFINESTGATEYLWDFDDGTPTSSDFDPSHTYSNPGTYDVMFVASNPNACNLADTSYLTIIVTSLDVTENITHPDCFGGSNGSIDLTIGEGTPPYIFTWDFGPVTEDVFDMEAGVYTVTVADSSGCQHIETYEITQPDELTAATDVQHLCPGEGDGSIVLSVDGGTPGYTYYWSNNETTQDIDGLSGGIYYVTVTDANSCTTVATDTVYESPPVTTVITGEDLLCNGVPTGIIDLTVSGGTPGYTFLWSDGQTDEDINDIPAGDYIVTITDAFNCTETESITINEPYVIVIDNYSSTDVTCYGDGDGTLIVVASGGTGVLTYTINGVPQNNGSFTGLDGGTYTVSVIDANNCIVTTDIVIEEPEELLISIPDHETICIGQTVVISVYPSGGTLPYIYEWDNGSTVQSIEINPVVSTDYPVTVTDSHNCEKSTGTTVYVYPPLALELYTNDDSICPGDAVVIHANPEGGNGGPYIYTIDSMPAEEPFTVFPDVTHTFTVYVYDDCGTPEATDEITVYILPIPPVNFTSDIVNGCQPLTVHFNEFNPDSGQTYLWDFDDNYSNNFSTQKTPAHIFEYPGIYDILLTVTSVDGCDNSLLYENMITVYPKPNAAFVANPPVASIIKPLIHFENVSSHKYLSHWSFGDGDMSEETHPYHMYDALGTYNVELIAETGHGCLDTTWLDVIIRDEYTFYAPTAFSPDDDGINDLFCPVGHGIDTGYFYLAIYDRWGEKIFETYKYNVDENGRVHEGWNGRVRDGRIAESGVYVWYVVYKNLIGTEYKKAGTITLIK